MSDFERDDGVSPPRTMQVQGQTVRPRGTFLASAAHSGENSALQMARGGCGCSLVGGGVLAITFFLLAMSGSNFEDLAVMLTLTLLLGVAPAAGGGWLIRSFVKHHLSARKQREERLILKVAGQKHGLISPVDVVRQTSMSLEAARRRLDAMTLDGYADRDVDERGVVYYRFPDLLPQGLRSSHERGDALSRAIDEAVRRSGQLPPRVL